MQPDCFIIFSCQMGYSHYKPTTDRVMSTRKKAEDYLNTFARRVNRLNSDAHWLTNNNFEYWIEAATFED